MTLKVVLALSALLLTGCLGSPLVLYVSSDFSEEEQPNIVEGARAFCYLGEDYCPWVVLNSDSDSDIRIRPARFADSCDGGAIASAWKFSRKRWTIEICPEARKPDRLAMMTAHEIGHIISGKAGHEERGLVMRKKPPRGSPAPNRFDEQYILGGGR